MNCGRWILVWIKSCHEKTHTNVQIIIDHRSIAKLLKNTTWTLKISHEVVELTRGQANPTVDTEQLSPRRTGRVQIHRNIWQAIEHPGQSFFHNTTTYIFIYQMFCHMHIKIMRLMMRSERVFSRKVNWFGERDNNSSFLSSDDGKLDHDINRHFKLFFSFKQILTKLCHFRKGYYWNEKIITITTGSLRKHFIQCF